MPDAPPTAPAVPPKRRWWKRWWVWLLATPVWLPVLLILVWLIWLAIATSQRNAAIAELREAGLPVTYPEMVANINPANESANTATEFMAAASLIEDEGESWVAFKEWHIPELEMIGDERARWIELQEAVVIEQSAALERFAPVDAKIRPTVDVVQADFGPWSALKAQVALGEAPDDPYSILLPSLHPVHDASKLLAADARVAATRRDYERALRQVVCLIGLSDAVAADGHCLVEYLVSVGIRMQAVSVVIEASDELACAPGELKAQVIELLLDETAMHVGYVQAIEGETFMLMETMAALDDGRITIATLGESAHNDSAAGRLLTYLAAPIGRGDAAQIARYMAAFRAAADAPTFPAATQIVPSSDTVATLSFLDLFASMLLPSTERVAEAHYRSRTDRRLAATSLAIAWYRADHDDQWPESLEALVPQYLPDVPRDAVAANAPLRYDAARRILWSVGTDGLDDGGDATSTRPKGGRATRWDGKDVVVELEWGERTSNTERPTSNPGKPAPALRCSMLNVPCWTFTPVPGPHTPPC